MYHLNYEFLHFQISYNSKLLNIISPTDCKLEIFDIQGKLVNTHELNFGVNSIFNQNLEGKVFIFKFQFSDGNHHFKKFIF